MQGTANQFWETLDIYMQAARAQGKLMNATELVVVVGTSIIQLTLANPQWVRECALDSWHRAGFTDAEYARALKQADELIQTVRHRQVLEGEMTDIADMRLRKAGLS